MIDIGVNLLHPQFDADRDAVLARAAAAGVRQLIVTGTDLDTSAAAVEYCRRHDARSTDHGVRLHCTAGIHPHDAGSAPPGWRTRITDLARAPEVVAVGETGLDFFRNLSRREIQIEVFRAQLALARRLGKPLFVHDRDAADAVSTALLDVLGDPALPGRLAADAPPVVVHCFTGDAGALTRYLNLGCHIGITGWVCDRRRGAELYRIAGRIPLDRLLIETDAPFLRPQADPGQAAAAVPSGRRNEPALLGAVAATLARAYGGHLSAQSLARLSAANARRVFRLPLNG
ncbi:MAG: TatD family hydrolase [Pseudomonadales bacterium]